MRAPPSNPAKEVTVIAVSLASHHDSTITKVEEMNRALSDMEKLLGNVERSR